MAAAATGEGGGGAGDRLRERGVGGEEGIERERPREGRVGDN